MGLLDTIKVTLIDRTWMRAGKSWRLMLQLPPEPVTLPPVLSGMIDTKVRVDLVREESKVEIDPALIVDVKHLKRQFILIVETCYESQNGIGPYVTGLLNQELLLTISKPGEKPQPAVGLQSPPPPKSKAPQEMIKGLHVLFQNQRFQQFIKERFTEGGGQINQMTPDLCKVTFKSMAGVESCRDLSEEEIKSWVSQFNEWIAGRRGAA